MVSDVDFIGQPDDPIEINLYGKAAFINNEAFRGGKTTMQNVKINIHKDNNTVFNIIGAGVVYTAAFRDVLTGWGGIQYTTKFLGSADINVNTKTNTIYAINHYSPGTQIENTGDIVFNGASNIGFSFLTYVPDKSKYIGETVPNWSTIGEATLDDYKPFVKTDSNHPIKMYGDENVGIFFNKRTENINGRVNVGIHQGTFKLYMIGICKSKY